MNEIIEAYVAGLQPFLGGMPTPIIYLSAVGIALAVAVFFASIPFIIFKRSN